MIIIKLNFHQLSNTTLTLENQCMQSIKLKIKKEISYDNLKRCRISDEIQHLWVFKFYLSFKDFILLFNLNPS